MKNNITDEYGIKWVSYHIKINSEFEGLEIGELTRDIVKPNDGEWVYEDKTSELKVGDIIYYWINIVHNGEEYILEDQQYRVKGAQISSIVKFFFFFLIKINLLQNYILAKRHLKMEL